jgi:hypothetical protein
MLTTPAIALGDWFDVLRLSFLPGQLAILAEVVGDDEIAGRRALQSLDMARADNQLLTLATMGHRHVISLILSDRYVDALDLVLRSSAALVARKILSDAGEDPFSTAKTADEVLGTKPSPQWSLAETMTMTTAVYPVLLRLATQYISAPETAAHIASDFVSACRSVMRSASEASLWRDVADLFEKIFVQRIPGSELVEAGNGFKSQNLPWLQAIAYIGATVQSDGRLEHAATAQLYTIGESKMLASPDSSAYRRVLLPYLETFWSAVFTHQSFRFTPPAIYRERFEAARNVAPAGRAQAILRVVYSGLGLPVPDRYKDWIAGTWQRTS